MTRPSRYEYHCARIKAAPDVCPVCGGTYLRPKDASFAELMRCHFQSPCYVQKRDVPGWKGFHTWWFVCDHAGRIDIELEKSDFLLNKIAKDATWQGGTFPIPFDFPKKLVGILG